MGGSKNTDEDKLVIDKASMRELTLVVVSFLNKHKRKNIEKFYLSAMNSKR